MRRKKLMITLCIIALAILGVVGCAPQMATPNDTAGSGTGTEQVGTDSNPLQAVQADLYNPTIITLADGTQIQRTPTEGEVFSTLDGSYTYHMPTETVPYNTYYLKADAKGCNACHADLAKTLEDMEYDHTNLTNVMGIQLTVQMCLDCHTYGAGYLTNQYSFGSLIHGIHSTEQNNDCWSCHVATGDGSGMQLWDKVKHWQLRGITPVAEVQGEFSFDQDKTIPAADLFDFGWDYFDWDYTRSQNTKDNTPLDQELFENWTITIGGAVQKETTFKLTDLIANYQSVEVPVTLQCTLNPIGGPFIGNVKYTGIKLSELLEDVGISPDAGALSLSSPDGFTEPLMMSNFTEAYLAYEADGEPLSWEHGYPVQLMVPGSAAPSNVKEISDIVVNTQEEAALLNEWNGWPANSGDGNVYTASGWPYTNENGYLNKPNVGIFDFTEGQIISTGKPYEFTGYAAAWDQQIAAVEFSMDGGVTWTHFDTPGAGKDRWTCWHFTYTPEVDSAYVLSVRSVTTDGMITPEPIEVMFNAKTS